MTELDFPLGQRRETENPRARFITSMVNIFKWERLSLATEFKGNLNY